MTQPEPLSPPAAELVATAAQRLLDDPTAFLASSDRAILDALPVLSDDADLAAMAQATSHANVTRWLVSMTRHPGALVGRDLTPESLEIARDLLRRGIGREVLWTGYRRGQNVTWCDWMDHVCWLSAQLGRTAVLHEALDATARSWFGFIDDILVNVDAQVSLELEQLRGGISQRWETVQLILQGAPITQARASERLGYDLAAPQLGLIIWTDPETDLEQGGFESLAGQFARAAGVGRPLVLPSGAHTLWMWAHAPRPPDLTALRRAIEDASVPVHVAVGTRVAGIAGFRDTHRQALDARKLARRVAAPAPLTSYDEVEVVVLASTDPDRVSHFVRETLGGLLDERREVRETLRTYLNHERSATDSARALFTHRNTVLNRLGRAGDLLPERSAGRSLAVHLALELDHWLGTAT